MDRRPPRVQPSHFLPDTPMPIRLTVASILLTGVLTPLAIVAQSGDAPRPQLAARSFASVEVHVNSRPIGRQWMATDAGLSGPARIATAWVPGGSGATSLHGAPTIM